MKSNEVHYYDLSGNDSWQLKMIKLINIFNYSIRQIQSTKCILNGVHQEKKPKHRDILSSSSRNSNVIESNLKSNSWKKSNVISLCQKVFKQLAQGAS
jgi:hypothetical protein